MLDTHLSIGLSQVAMKIFRYLCASYKEIKSQNVLNPRMF